MFPEAGNSLNLTVMAVVGRWSTFVGNISGLLPSDVIDFEMLPAQRFWRERGLLLDVM